MMNFCSNIVYYLYIYTAFDIILLLLYYHVWPTFRGHLASGLSTRPSSPTSLWAPYSASGLHHSTDSLIITMFMSVLVYTNIILCRYSLLIGLATQ